VLAPLKRDSKLNLIKERIKLYEKKSKSNYGCSNDKYTFIVAVQF